MLNRILLALFLPLSLFAQNPEALPKSVNFFVIGDWGREGKYDQQAVADQMALLADDWNLDFVTTVGDNFYLKGVKSVEDDHWEKSFNLVYHHESLQVPFYASLGNHDYWGNVQAQIDRTELDNRWNLPSRYYSKLIELNEKPLIRLIVTDTNPWYDPYYTRHWYQDEIHGRDTSKQMNWLDSTLALDDAPWEIVIGHHPMYTSGKRHGNPNPVADQIEKLLKKHKIPAYFAGHEHHLEHYRKDYGTDCYISGAAAKTREIDENPDGMFATDEAGFMAVSINKKAMRVYIIDKNGKVLEQIDRKR